MLKSNPFKWRHHQPEIILLCERFYLTYPLSYRQVAEMVSERGWAIQYFSVRMHSPWRYPLIPLNKATVYTQVEPRL